MQGRNSWKTVEVRSGGRKIHTQIHFFYSSSTMNLARAAAFLSCTVAIASGAECPDLDKSVAISDTSVLHYAIVGATDDGTPGYMVSVLDYACLYCTLF